MRKNPTAGNPSPDSRTGNSGGAFRKNAPVPPGNDPRAAFFIGSESAPGRTTLRIVGDLDMDSVLKFRDAAFSIVGERPEMLLLDLTGAPFVDTTGLSALVTVVRVAKLVDVTVQVLPSPHLRRVLHSTGLVRVLPIAKKAI